MKDASDSKLPKLRLDANLFFEIATEALEANSKIEFTPRGRSMIPTLRDARDSAVLERADDPKKLDLVLYRRDSKQYVLHRIVRVERDGTFTMCGDGQTALERGIRREQILARVVEFTRGALKVDCRRSILFRCYSRVWVATRPIRALCFRAKSVLSRIARS